MIEVTPVSEHTPHGWRVERWHPIGTIAMFYIRSADNTIIAEFRREERAHEAVKAVNNAGKLAVALDELVASISALNILGHRGGHKERHQKAHAAAQGALAAWSGKIEGPAEPPTDPQSTGDITSHESP